jgi:hypothetical protein
VRVQRDQTLDTQLSLVDLAFEELDLRSADSPFVFELANLNDNEGYVIGHSAVSPRRDAIENRLFHLG